ncbi:cyclic nucleotide-gated cation channel beta-1-like isoform X2 [Gigantopelta aegis]|uniref:cyclic nucleotide-gated cation channel beta-1-like isoform X2 n=1 Tax=Gigantopelta aegis TaxID=1735272 RepID=UPI001B88BD54|nr:cyclic nucleotide-gated cation channel beta-1-like isoform X2 [Gigantopelta aegis]
MIWKLMDKLWQSASLTRPVTDSQMYSRVSDTDEDLSPLETVECERCESHTPLLRSRRGQDVLTCPHVNSLKGVRRSSLSSTWSRDSALSHRRLNPISSLSIENMSVEPRVPALRSPGLLSTASMWNTSDLTLTPAKKHHDFETLSCLTNSNSLSNVSSTLSERMHELVRAFSSRTQRTKERTCQPPSPTSLSSYDGKSAVSASDFPQPTRQIRLGSFVPMESSMSEAMSEVSATKEQLVGVWHCRLRLPKCCHKLRFPNTMESHSKVYVAWLFIVVIAFMYNAWVIPLRGIFPYQSEQNVYYWLIFDYSCDLIYIIDIVVFKIRIRFINDGIVELDRRKTRKHYMMKGIFKMDMLSLMPLDLFYFLTGVNPWLRLPRLLKIQTFWEFYEKCDQAAKSSAYAIRIIKTITYMLFLIHVETCGYYAMSVYEGINTNPWVYNGKGNAYIRCFYLATKTATSIGNNPKPTNLTEYLFMTLYWLSGVFVFALLIGQVRNIVESAGLVKTRYRQQVDAVMRYMDSIDVPKAMHNRVRHWFMYNWEQHSMTDEKTLLDSLPKKLQTDLAISVHFNTLSKVQLFQDCDKNLLYDLVLKLRPVLYLPHDYICEKGEVGKEMYIVSEGQVEVVGGEDGETILATLHEGSVFGEISLLAMSGGNRRTANVRCKGYVNLFTLSKADFEEAMREYPEAQKLLRKRAKKLLKENARLERKSKKIETEEIIKTPSTKSQTPKMIKAVIQVLNPQSEIMKHLEPNRSVSLKSSRSIASNAKSYSSNIKISIVNKSDDPQHSIGSPRYSADDLGSQLSLSDIPDDDADCFSLSEDDEELLVIEKMNPSSSSSSEEETLPDDVPTSPRSVKEDNIDKDNVDKNNVDKNNVDKNNSLESQDSGIPSMKQSRSTEFSNQDSRENFNNGGLLTGIHKENKNTKCDQSEENANIPPQSLNEEMAVPLDPTKETSPDNSSVDKESRTDKSVDKETRMDNSVSNNSTVKKETGTDNSIIKKETITDNSTLNKEARTDNAVMNKEKGADNSTNNLLDQPAVLRPVSRSSSRSGLHNQSDGNTSQQSRSNSVKDKNTKELEQKNSEVNKESKDSKTRTSDSTNESKPKKDKPEIPPKPKRSSKDENKNSLSKTDFSNNSGVEEHNVIEYCADVEMITTAQMGMKRKVSDRRPNPVVLDRNIIHMAHLVNESEIPQQNQVITSVEIHREKTLSPASIFSLSEQTGRPESRELTRQKSNSSYETQL